MTFMCYVCMTEGVSSRCSEYHIRWCSDNGAWEWKTVCKQHCPAHANGANTGITCRQWAEGEGTGH